MSFQAYLDNIEQKTGKTPEQLVQEAKDKGFTADTRAGDIVKWLNDDYDLGRGHAMAIIYVFKRGTKIGDAFVGSDGVHRDESDTLRLDGIDKR